MRDTYLDTSKAVLIFLVVFGHFLERMIGWENPINHTLLATIYVVHMPAFIFISGLLYKDKNWFKNIIFFIALYLPFQILFPAFEALWTGKFQLSWNIFVRPYWILWYLMGMMVWTLLTHFLIKTKFPVIIAIAMALCVGLSPWNNYQYSIGRIFVFFPFFMLGCCYGRAIIQFIQQRRSGSIIGLCIIFGIIAVVDLTQINQFWLYGSLSYTQLQVSNLDGTLIRMGCLLLSSLGIFAILSLAQRMGQRFIQLGRNTLAVYLLHGFIVIFITRFWQFNFHISIQILICLIFSIISCWILQHNIFDKVLRKLSLWLMLPTEKLWHK
ncbi:acyltransferase family protein [Acinetobacter sp. ANC 4648]|uniref:acyltransferase family protein n=1 Tax=Acinetobacter sp. ANC 4648 TaxID=1977875 RepID=UPI000A32B6F6|nr:acyltransferase family protein [Acinetobacter sp. ANC 4648]OTG84783.1 acyltransferase [Acinetobacter sp. ANC 4648]